MVKYACAARGAYGARARSGWCYRRRRFKKIYDQVVRLKLDYAGLLSYPLDESGKLGFDNREGTQGIGFGMVFDDAIETITNANNYTQLFSYMKLYGVRMEITCTKPIPATQTFGGAAYVGFQTGKNLGVPTVDTLRGLSTCVQLPAYGAPTVTKFWRLKDMPWIPIEDGLSGGFFVNSNLVAQRQAGPMWECKLSLYIKFKGNTG